MRKIKFQAIIRHWYRRHGRHDLPWRKARDPYCILVSEVMLQQTQVSRVIPKYRKFLKVFPSLATLDRALLRRVLRLWQGLGYNRRAVYLKRLARTVIRDHRGEIPKDLALLRRLPGIGPATAGAVCAFAFGKRMAFLETNIRRVYLHFFFPRQGRVRDTEILEKIRATLPRRGVREWYYALIDYGAMALGTIPNPNRRSAHHVRQPAFAGSRRQARGKILAAVIREPRLAEGALRERIGKHPLLKPFARKRVFDDLLHQLEREGLIRKVAERLAPAR